VATLALAGSAALVLGVGDAIGYMSASAEALFIATQLLGWTLLAWATILGGLGAIQLLRRLVSRQSPAWPDVLLHVAGAAVIVAVICTHPLWGSGSGLG
jgi:MFS superfamily sulfate permease-like transporter